jgi:ribonuclease MRP protein subunit RMP1
MFDIDKIDTQSLSDELEIIHLLYHRNRNQHRHSVWWKQFAILKRRTRLVLELTKESRDAHIIEKHVKFIVYKIISRAYFLFHGILTQGEYINLGFALIAILGRVFAIFKESLGTQEDEAFEGDLKLSMELKKKSSSLSRSNLPAGDYIGESISRESLLSSASMTSETADQDPSNSGTKRKSKSDNSTKKKKRKSKNDIDAIFGF